MNRDVLKIALILSLAFNIAVVGALAYGFVRKSAPENYCSMQGRGAPPDSFGRECRHFARDIGVPHERAARFSRVMADTSGGMRETRSRLQKARAELVALLGAERPDEKSIMAKVDEISGLQGELEKRLVRRLIDASSTLDPAERERLMHVVRFRCFQSESGIPGGPPGPESEREVR